MRIRRNRQGGFVISLELVFLCTIVVAAVLIGATSLAAKLTGEFADVGTAVGSLNQSYQFTGMAVGHPADPIHPIDIGRWAGSQNIDFLDFCDTDPNCACGVRMCIAPSVEFPHP